MDIKDAKPCPRCGEQPTIVKDPVFYGRLYCACNNPLCEWYKLVMEKFSGHNVAWAVSRWNMNRVGEMKEEDGFDWKAEIRK